MGPRRIRAGTRRRLLGAGLAVGVLVGAASGAAMFTGAAPSIGGPRPLVLHAAPALVVAERPAQLAAATFCHAPDAPSCEVVAATGFVRPAGVTGWSPVEGRFIEGAYRFTVPSEYVPAEGFTYRFEFRTRDGGTIAYPPGGEQGAIRVVTTAGLPVRQIPPFLWEPREADGVAVAMPYGDGDGEVGRWTGTDEEVVVGPSSFDVADDGSVLVSDWVHHRIQEFSPSGRFRRALPMPTGRPVDLAVGADGAIALSTLGTSATVFELDARGGVLGRYPVAFGVASKVSATPTGPRVLVGAAQWAPVRSRPGVPLEASAQGKLETTSVPLRDGTIGSSADVDQGSFASVWTRPDGSRGGAVVRLPSGVEGGTDYFVRPLPDGGAIVAKGLWDATHFGVGLFRFGASGQIVSFDLLPEPSTEQAARYSTVRFLAPDQVLLAVADDRGVHIDRFDVR